jgi:hypothetical protein
MTHQDLLNITLSVHVAVLLGALAAWYKYGDRSDVLAKSLKGTDIVLTRLRIMISSDLTKAIREVLSTIPTNPQAILGPDGKNPIYSEKVSNFLESEAFRQAIRDFIDSRADVISDYRVLTRARANWCFWARILSWSILVLIILQAFFLAGHGFMDKILGNTLPNWCLHGSLTITGFVVLFVFCLPFPILLRNHDTIIQQKVKYDAP